MARDAIWKSFHFCHLDTLQQCLSLGLSSFFFHIFFSPLQMAISCHINFCQNRKRGYRDLVYAQYAWQSRRRRRRRYASWVPGFTVYTYIGTVSSYHRARSNTIVLYLLACEVDLVFDIMAQMWRYIIFLAINQQRWLQYFFLNYLKKVLGGATTQKNLKTNIKTMISSIWTCPQGLQGCWKKRHRPLNKVMEIWCTKIEPKLKIIWKIVRKQAFLTIIFQFWLFFEVSSILAQS